MNRLHLAPFVCAAALAAQTPQEALAAQQAGDMPKAIGIFEALASKGDTRAMVTLGVFYHSGNGVKQDYAKAYDWYIRAVQKDNNGDAWNNLAVMHRDGLGVVQDKQLAWACFFLVYTQGFGGQDTQVRNGRNLERVAPELSEAQRKEASEWSVAYLRASLAAKGALKPIPDHLKAGPKQPSLAAMSR